MKKSPAPNRFLFCLIKCPMGNVIDYRLSQIAFTDISIASTHSALEYKWWYAPFIKVDVWSVTKYKEATEEKETQHAVALMTSKCYSWVGPHNIDKCQPTLTVSEKINLFVEKNSTFYKLCQPFMKFSLKLVKQFLMYPPFLSLIILAFWRPYDLSHRTVSGPLPCPPYVIFSSHPQFHILDLLCSLNHEAFTLWSKWVIGFFFAWLELHDRK